LGRAHRVCVCQSMIVVLIIFHAHHYVGQGCVSAIEFETALREQLLDYAQRRMFYDCCAFDEVGTPPNVQRRLLSPSSCRPGCAPSAALHDLRLILIATQGSPAIYPVGPRSQHSSATILRGPQDSPEFGKQLPSFCHNQLQAQALCFDGQGQVCEHIAMQTGNAPRTIVQSPLHASLVEVMMWVMWRGCAACLRGNVRINAHRSC
jgi:hypothetical protein